MSDLKDTLNLPDTKFEMRAGLAQKEPAALAKWAEQKLYEAIQDARKDAPLYALHDGPPYANGHLHNGHILNKILKDLVVKFETMQGKRVPYVPGWDCHGLPIEVQVDKELGPKKAGMSKVELRRAYRAYADKFVGIQRDEFKRLGVFGRWDDPYKTMAYGYEAQTLRELAKFAANGLLYKALRAVNWCMTHQTALAEAEIEYEDHKSPSVYVAFPLLKGPPGVKETNVDIVIWTTTPWTLPANLAVAVHPDLEYVTYPVKGRARIFAKGLAEQFLKAVGEPPFDEKKVIATTVGRELESISYRHVFLDRQSPVVLGEHVTLEAGTGCVHTAPGHGADDFEVGKKYGLPVLSPVDGRGVFTSEGGPFAGKKVFEANPEIIALLAEKGALLNAPTDTVSHRYAHCWRCHNPIITRATEQWWVPMDKPFGGGGSLRERSLAALKDVTWIPSWGEDRIRGMLAGRPDWCLSRQRTWGVPIAVFYCEGCNTPKVDPALMNKVADVFEEKSGDAWFTDSVEQLVGALKCDSCGASKFRKEEDILDVWFDSGVSFAAVVEREKGLGHTSLSASSDVAKLGHETRPVDLYLEGSDQHRGWFHSSLLCSLATRGRPPYKEVLTHGFVVDGQGKKISKSKGNFVDPFKSINENGAELWRLWVASEDYREDIRISPEILTRLTDTYRKTRNTLRFLLGNVSDFQPKNDWASDLFELDRYMLAVHEQFVHKVVQAYQEREFHVVLHAANHYCTVELSAFYLDVLKDRLYADKKSGPARRSAQTALYVIARDLLRVLAPILSFTAEEAYGVLVETSPLGDEPKSVHLALMPGVQDPAPIASLRARIAKESEALMSKYAPLLELKKKVNAALEEARRQKVIGSSAEAHVTLAGNSEHLQPAKDLGKAALEALLIVSHATLAPGSGDITVSVARAQGTKCERCWLYRDDVKEEAAGKVCGRCRAAL